MAPCRRASLATDRILPTSPTPRAAPSSTRAPAAELGRPPRPDARVAARHPSLCPPRRRPRAPIAIDVARPPPWSSSASRDGRAARPLARARRAAFARLQDDLRPLARFGDLDVQFVEPPVDRPRPAGRGRSRRARDRAQRRAGARRRGRSRAACASSGTATASTCSSASATTARRAHGRRRLAAAASPSGSRPSTAPRRDVDARLGIRALVRLPLDPPAGARAARRGGALSPREREVLRALASGPATAPSPTSLGISENTVKFHVSNLLRKAGAARAPSSSPRPVRQHQEIFISVLNAQHAAITGVICSSHSRLFRYQND